MKRISILFLLLFLLDWPLLAQKNDTKISLNAAEQESKIDKNIYGQFAEDLGHLIYGGIWVEPQSSIPNIDGLRKDVVRALREIRVPILRWPGGCFADQYHWMDGIGPRDKRPETINTNWGGVTDNNAFGTAEFLELCKLIGCQPYFSGNLGSGTVKELSDWVEYVNSNDISTITKLRKKYGREKAWGVKYWGLGNESWGCGGRMTPEYYSDLLRRYSAFMPNYGGLRLFKIASGPNADDYLWTSVVMKDAGSYIDGLSLHYYASAPQRTATDFDEAGWFDIMKKSLRMDELIRKHSAIMDEYDPLKRVALVVDEWGTWYKVEPGTNPGFLYQQNTLRDAVAAASTLNIFNNHCDRVRMANIAQVVNVLQSMVLTKGARMILTPTYYIFYMYRVHQDAMMVPIKIKSASYAFEGDSLPAVNCSASIDTTGKMHISLCNIDPDTSESVEIDLNNFNTQKISGSILTAARMTAHNSFENPEAIEPAAFSNFSLNGNRLEVAMPAKSVVVLELAGSVQMKASPSIELNNPVQGLNYDYYKLGDLEGLTRFSLLTPDLSGLIESIVLPKFVRDENFGMRYRGFVKIPSSGVYTFYTTSDDGSALLIDGKIVVNNDGRHVPIEMSGMVGLSAGYHKIELLYFQAGGGMELSAGWKGPGFGKEAIPETVLFTTR